MSEPPAAGTCEIEGLISGEMVATSVAWSAHYVPAVAQARKALKNCYHVNHEKMYSACDDFERHYQEVFHASVRTLYVKTTLMKRSWVFNCG